MHNMRGNNSGNGDITVVHIPLLPRLWAQGGAHSAHSAPKAGRRMYTTSNDRMAEGGRTTLRNMLVT